MNIKKLEQILIENKQPGFRRKQVIQSVFKEYIDDFDKMTNLPKDLREILKKEINILPFDVVQVLESRANDSMKALLKLKDGGHLIETVLISPKPGFWSACISSQVGCPMGCRFCATGELGLIRNLTSDEIYDQVLFWKIYLKAKSEKLKVKNPEELTNVVYMGMGEPFANWANVKESLEILIDKEYFDMASRSISVSTSGIAEGIEKLANDFPQVNLALSLHFSNDLKRSEHMPVNKKDNMQSLKIALQNYLEKTNRKIFLEYVLLDGINDMKEDALELASYIKSIGKPYLLHVNLIRYNVAGGNYKPASKNAAIHFKLNLKHQGVNATIRKSLGDEIKGACGQLAGK